MSTLISTEETLVYVLRKMAITFRARSNYFFFIFLTPKPLRNKHRCMMKYLTEILVYMKKNFFSYADIHFISMIVIGIVTIFS